MPWIEVSRMDPWVRGFGYVAEGQGYGCWFGHTPGSGLWIQLEKVLRLHSRYPDANNTLCHTCDGSTPILSTWYETVNEVPLCRDSNCSCDCSGYDANWPMKAYLRGYDSMVIERSAINSWGDSTNEETSREVVILHDSCMFSPSPVGACPPVPVMVTNGEGRFFCTECVCKATQCSFKWTGSLSCEIMACAKTSTVRPSAMITNRCTPNMTEAERVLAHTRLHTLLPFRRPTPPSLPPPSLPPTSLPPTSLPDAYVNPSANIALAPYQTTTVFGIALALLPCLLVFYVVNKAKYEKLKEQRHATRSGNASAKPSLLHATDSHPESRPTVELVCRK